MITIIAVITRIFSNSIANLFQKKATEHTSPLLTNLYAYFIMSALCIIPACFVNWAQFNFHFWLNVIFAGILCTVGTIALIEALRIGELSVLAPINAYKSVIGVIGAFLLLGEIPGSKEILCIFAIIIGSYFVLESDKLNFSIKIFFRRDIRLRFLALFCSGIEAAFLKKIILMSSFDICLILWCFSGFLCSLIISLINDKPVSLKPQNLRSCFIIAIMLILMQFSTNYVFSVLDVGVSLALFQLSSLVSLFFGYKIYRERHILKKTFGTVIMLVSAALILM